MLKQVSTSPEETLQSEVSLCLIELDTCTINPTKPSYNQLTSPIYGPAGARSLCGATPGYGWLPACGCPCDECYDHVDLWRNGADMQTAAGLRMLRNGHGGTPNSWMVLVGEKSHENGRMTEGTRISGKPPYLTHVDASCR